MDACMNASVSQSMDGWDGFEGQTDGQTDCWTDRQIDFFVYLKKGLSYVYIVYT